MVQRHCTSSMLQQQLHNMRVPTPRCVVQRGIPIAVCGYQQRCIGRNNALRHAQNPASRRNVCQCSGSSGLWLNIMVLMALCSKRLQIQFSVVLATIIYICVAYMRAHACVRLVDVQSATVHAVRTLQQLHHATLSHCLRLLH